MNCQVVCWCPLKLQGVVLVTEAIQVGANPFAISADTHFVDNAIASPLVAGNSASELVFNERARDHTKDFKAVEVCENGFEIRFKFLRWPLVNEVHSAADRVSAVQGTLRSTQNFDSFQIPQAAR